MDSTGMPSGQTESNGWSPFDVFDIDLISGIHHPSFPNNAHSGRMFMRFGPFFGGIDSNTLRSRFDKISLNFDKFSSRILVMC
jgi:hypothetical protein